MLLIIAYGNTLRGDDGAGLLLGELLEQECRNRAIAAELLTCHQLAPELVADMIRPEVDMVVFSDTRIASPGSSGLNIDIEPLTPHPGEHASGHHLNPQTLLLLTERLYGKRLPAWQMTIPGTTFDHGELLSTTVRRALEQAPERLQHFLEGISVPPPWGTDSRQIGC